MNDKTHRRPRTSNSTDRPVVGRRGFMAAFATGAVLGPLASMSSLTAGDETAPGDLALSCSVAPNKAVLTAADISYLGAFKMPWANTAANPFRYSNGCLTARRVNGELRFIVSGQSQALPAIGPMVTEMSYPGYSRDLNNAPRATAINAWTSLYPDRPLVKGGAFPMLWGLHAEGNQLWWSYSADYEGVTHNPSIGVSVLGPNGSLQTYGPWRTEAHSAAACGYMMRVPGWFQPHIGQATHLIGNPPHVANANASFGANLQAWTPPALTTPADSIDNTHVSVRTKPLLFYPSTNPMPRTANYKSCGWNVRYDAAAGGWVKPGVPAFGGLEHSALLDWMDSCAWVDLPEKHGVVFFGQLVDTIAGRDYGGDTQTHVWYGANPCPHGQTSRGQVATGPGAGSIANQVWIYDPTQLIEVGANRKRSYQVQPASTFRASDLGGFVPEERTHYYTFGGAYFDAETQQLFLAEIRRETAGCCDPLPVVHVFRING